MTAAPKAAKTGTSEKPAKAVKPAKTATIAKTAKTVKTEKPVRSPAAPEVFPLRRVDPHDILIAPLVTEKSTMMRERHNQIAFIVSNRANKTEVKKAVEEALKVKVESVNIINIAGKKKRMGKFAGTRPSWKKGIVTLKAGEKIELFEGS